MTTRPKITNREAATLKRFGVSIDDQNRVVVAPCFGAEVVVHGPHHKLFIMGCKHSDRTLITAHGPEYTKRTVLAVERQNEDNVALGHIDSFRS